VRLAWFTPWSPQTSGVAGRSDAVTSALAARGWGIDIVVDTREVGSLPRASADPVAPGQRRLQSAHDFVWRAVRGQYDLTVYQVGNSRHHDFLWPYLFRWPGLSVLHDARLHHARARRLLRPNGPAAYREEFRFSQPAVAPDVAELAVHGFDGRYYSQWPMTRAVVLASRAVAAHAQSAANDLRQEYPECPISYLPLGYGRVDTASDEDVTRTRRAHGADDHAVVFGVFGGLSLDKRVPEVLKAFATHRRRHPDSRLWLAGAPDPRVDVAALARQLDIDAAVTDLGVPDDDAFDRAIGAVDVSLNLRWPSALETSGPWLQALAAGRPTVIMELPQLAHVPALDPHDWRPRNPVDSRPPVTVSIDVLDEHHSLVAAMDRLASDRTLRTNLGEAARRYWESEHTLDRMTDGYETVLRQAMRSPEPSVGLPPSLRPDVWQTTRRWIEPFGTDRCELP
jgi:glycosyltransferase involved in cell wall biosynthesis